MGWWLKLKMKEHNIARQIRTIFGFVASNIWTVDIIFSFLRCTHLLMKQIHVIAMK